MTMGTFTTVGLVEEGTWGTTPASALQLMNVTGFNLSRDRDPQRPNVLTGDRRRFPTRHLRRAGNLRIPTILQYENDLLLLEGVLNATRGSAVSITGTGISFVAASGQINDSGNGFANLSSGDRIYISGADAANNGWKGPIVKVNSGQVLVPIGQVADEAAGDSITIQTRRLQDGTTLKEFSVERQHTGLTTNFESTTGARVGSANLSWGENAWVTEEFSLICKDPVAATATIGTGAATAALQTPYATGIDVQTFTWGSAGNAASAIVTQWNLSIANVLAAQYGIGNEGLSGISVGPCDVGLEFSCYMDDNAQDIKDACDSHGTVWVAWDVEFPKVNTGSAHGAMVSYCLPACHIDDANDPTEGPEQEVMLGVTLTAHDPAKDDASEWNGDFSYQVGAFFIPEA